MRKRVAYTCGAKPLGENGGRCGGTPGSHSVQQLEVWSPVLQRFVPQHRFVAQEV